jgi:phosphohistidine phosphatase
MILYIVRHAVASDRDEKRWPDDAERPLTKEGRKRFKRLLKALNEDEFNPGVVATSPLVRCRETAELVAKHSTGEPRIQCVEALAPGSDLSALLHWTSLQEQQKVAWVGHSPDVEHLAGALTGGTESSVRFAKGAIAAIQFEDQVSRGAGQLLWLATAKSLGV